jgi:peptide/nickel transport system substrate-binding protein
VPLWLVTPMAWAQTTLARPAFDGNGRLILQELHRLPPAGAATGAKR